MSDLRLNKIFGAVLGTGLVILGLQQVSSILFHAEAPEKPGYAVEVQEEAEAGPAQAEAPPDWGTVLPAANVAAGETVFGKCVSCHSIAAGGPNMTGPNLYGIVGRRPASHAGFAYSDAMTAFAGEHPAWDYQALYDFIHAPQQDVKGTKMTFVGVKDREQLINLIAYMRTQAASPAPIPAPNPAAAEAPAAETATAGADTGADAAEPTAAAPGAPATSSTANPAGQAPAAGAAAAPAQVTEPQGNPGQ